mmetsp:Transcript_61027/g.132319  ORF Transcript_61027/g.132319 Transcript_61027/m.132319 type:complete len:176 (+) Transcript_61027:89-616(+)
MELFDRSWYAGQLDAIKQSVEDPDYADHGETHVLEVVIRGATLDPLPQETSSRVRFPFVRLWVDGELVGESSQFRGPGDSSKPIWNERMLVMPQKSWCARLEVCEGSTEYDTSVRCSCALGTEGLWNTAMAGRFVLDVPLLHQAEAAPIQVGTISLAFRHWDGQPCQEGESAAPF